MLCRMRASLLTYVKVAFLFATCLQHVCGDSKEDLPSNSNQQGGNTVIQTSNIPQTTTTTTTPRTGFFLSYTRDPTTVVLTDTTTTATTTTATTTTTIRRLPTALSSTASTTSSQQQTDSKEEGSVTASTTTTSSKSTASSIASTLLAPTSTPASTIKVTDNLTTSTSMTTTTTGSIDAPTSTPAVTAKVTGDSTSTSTSMTVSSDSSKLLSTISVLLPFSSEENGEVTFTSSSYSMQTSSSPTVTQTNTTSADLSSPSTTTTTTTTTTSSTSQAAAATTSSTAASSSSSSGPSTTSPDIPWTQTSSLESTVSLVASISSSTPSDYSTTVSTTSVEPDNTSSSVTAASSSSTPSKALESSTQSSTSSVDALKTISSEPSSSTGSTVSPTATTTLTATTTTPASSSALSSTSEQPTTTTSSEPDLQSPTSTSSITPTTTTSTQTVSSVSFSQSSLNESKSTTVNSVTPSIYSTQSSTTTQSQPYASTSSSSPDNRIYCSQDFSSYLNWPVTVISSTFYQPCPFEGDGNASRQCYQNMTNGLATWSAVNLGDCTTESDLLRLIKELQQNETNLDTPAIFAFLASTLASQTFNIRLSADELLKYSKVLYQQASYRATQRLPFYEEELSDVASTVDNLLSSINAEAWSKQSNNTAAVNVLSAINMYGDLWSKQQAANVTILKENIVIQAGSTSSQNQYPILDDSSGWTDIKDSGIFISNFTRQAILRAVGSDQYVYSCSMMRNMASYLNATQTANMSIANNLIISLSINNFVSTASKAAFDIVVTNTQNISSENTTVECVYWDFISNKWSSENCSAVTLSHNSNYTTCSCNHLTNFAILVSPYSGPSPDSALGQALSYISLIGCIVSAVCCFLTVVVYVVQWKIVKSHRAVVLINLCIALIVANVVFLTGADKTYNKDACTAVAALLHYFFLAAFFLMLLEGIQLSIYVFAVFHVHKKRHTFAMIFAAWFLPMVIVGISLGATRTLGYGDSQSCWLSFENGLVWAAFVAPVLVIIAVNIVILIAVLIQLARVNIQSTTGAKNSKIKSFFRNILVLLPLLGITWVFGVISVNEQLVAFQFIFAIANGLQGVFIFIFHAICNSKVRGSKKGRGSSSQAWNKKSNSRSQRNFVRLQDHEKTPPPPPHYIGPFAVDSDFDLSANGSASNNSSSNSSSSNSRAYSQSTAETSASSDNGSRYSSQGSNSDVTSAARRHKSFENNNSGNAPRQYHNGLTRRHTDIVRSGSDKSNDSVDKLTESCAERHSIERQISSFACDGDVVLRNDNPSVQFTPTERVNSFTAATSL